jgi:PPP family 3-phenylpropionic acid transporter
VNGGPIKVGCGHFADEVRQSDDFEAVVLPRGTLEMRGSGPIAYVTLYAALYAAFGVASRFWPKYFETRALTPEQIGVILWAALLVRLVLAFP